MSRFANLADKPKASPTPQHKPAVPDNEGAVATTVSISAPPRSNSLADNGGLHAVVENFRAAARHRLEGSDVATHHRFQALIWRRYSVSDE